MKKILVIQTAFVGDLFLSIPFLKQLKKIFPDGYVSILCRQGTGEFLTKTGLVDNSIEVDKKNKSQLNRKLKELYSENFDMLFCLHQSTRSHLISLKIHASHKYGFKNFWNFFVFDSRINKDYSRPDALRQLSLLGVVDKDVLAKIESLSDCHGKNLTLQESTKDYFFKESIPPWASMNVADHIKPTILLSELSTYISSRKTIFIAPGSVWATKKWSKEGYREVIEEWVDEANIVLVGSKGEIELCQELAKGIDSIIDLSGQTSLYELAGVFKQGDVLVTNDSGAMHVAASAGLPILSIFGPTTLKIGYRPWSSQATVIQRPLKCRPCGKHGHDKCPIGTHECMKSISAKVVSSHLKKYFLT